MDIQSIEKHILEYALKGMPSYRNIIDTRNMYISILYDYLSDIIQDQKIFDETIKEVMFNYINFDTPFELTLDKIYDIHINIINRIYNKYLFKKYNITEEYGIKIEDTFMCLSTKSLINFKLTTIKNAGYNNCEFYQLDIKTDTRILIPDELKTDNISVEDVINLSETNFHEFKRKYEQFYIKYNRLINQINETELNDLKEKCSILKINNQ